MSYISIDIDVEEIVYNLSSYEKKNLLKELLNDMDAGVIIKAIKEAVNFKKSEGTAISIITGDDSTFESACRILAENKWRLDLADENYILKLANKL
jgi:hypothetical protein